MSRILRFRVWDVTERRWGSFEAFIGEGYTDLNDKRNDVIITQFTGLLDSKGREIWEGDILSKKRWDGSPFVVQWGMHHGNHSVGYVYGFEMPDRALGPWEVIGNIFEHSHLLK